MPQRRAPLPFIVMALAAGCGDGADTARPPPAVAFTAEDEDAVRALEERYRSAWLANDSAAVMATLAPEAVLMPGGEEPLVGERAIRAFWWPDDGSSTAITSYEIAVREVAGSGNMAFLRGEGALAFDYVDSDGQTSHLTSRAAHLSIARRGQDGQWKIARRAWSAIR